MGCTTGGAVDVATKCTTRDAKCGSMQTKKKAPEKAAVDPKCVAKTCADYATNEATCKKGPSCKFTAGKAGTAGTMKCAAQTGADGTTKDLCVKADFTKCALTVNGGASCCKAVVNKAAVLPVGAKCDKDGAVTAVTSAFAAAAAFLLM